MERTDYLFLDDIRTPISTRHVQLPRANWKVVRNYDEFCAAIRQFYNDYQAVPDFIAFDHDLDAEHYRESMLTNPDKYNSYYDTFEEKTGYDCAKWLVDFCLQRELTIPDWICHSMNPVGSMNINTYLRNAKEL